MSIPGSASPLLLASTAAAAGGDRSLRFNAADTAHLNRTPAVAGDRTKWTWAAWVKRSELGRAQFMFNAGPDTANDTDQIHTYFNASDAFGINSQNTQFRITTQVFRDVSAWYHFVIAVDTTQGTANDRIKFYVNGSQVTTFSVTANPTQNANTGVNATTQHTLGRAAGTQYTSAAFSFSGYLANTHLIDGQQLTPSSFTETDATTGQLIPKTYTGGYGTNGFNLLFADNSSNTASTLGKDTSGLSNNWTPNNLSVTAGAGNDSLVDSPTNYGTDTGVGGEVRGNYATWNPLALVYGTPSLSNGNLDSASNNSVCISTIGIPPTGKWYCEVSGTNVTGGICPAPRTVAIEYNLGSGVTGVIGIAVNRDADEIKLYKNNVLQSTTNITSGGISTSTIAFIQSYSGGTLNAGQRAFAYTAPSGFKALCTQNLPAPLVTKSNTVFDVKLYTGTSSSNPITGLGFAPDLVWLKVRSSTANHWLVDSVRTASAGGLSPNTTSAEGNNERFTSFDANGFTVTSGAGETNNSGDTYVGWAWDAGTSTVSNTAGSITSQVRANATAGFSVVTFTTNSSSGNATLGHGLGVAPKFFIVKSRNAAYNWDIYHGGISNAKDGRLVFTTAAFTTSVVPFGGVDPTSTVFTLSQSFYGTGINCVAYCFTPVVGYNSISSYTGNGSSDGPFVYTGFRPRWILIKETSGGESWAIFDTARNTYNTAGFFLRPDSSLQEHTSGSVDLDILSNGFKLRSTNATINAARTYIYAAFAEAPFNYSRAR